MRAISVLLIALGGCALNADVVATPLSAAGSSPHCAAGPTAAHKTSFRSSGTSFYAGLGSPRHRGVDTIALEGEVSQLIEGKLAYSKFDKPATNEDVYLYACLEDRWIPLGAAMTDGEGRFFHALRGKDRLPAGTHELYGHVIGDGTGFRWLAYIARRGERVIVSDIDGTLTEGEHAIVNTVLFGDDIAHRPRAPEALRHTGHSIVYVSARGDQYTEVTRRWLAAHGFPRGPIRHARTHLLPAGPKQQKWKTETLRDLGVPIAAAVGNRYTDIAAYASTGLAPAQILIKLPEFAAEVRPSIEAKRAVGFRDYRDLPRLLATSDTVNSR